MQHTDFSLKVAHVCVLVMQVERALVSGLDAVMVLEVPDFTLALKRALGRRLDPATGRVYHLEFAPPPANDPGLVGRLQELDDYSNDAGAWGRCSWT